MSYLWSVCKMQPVAEYRFAPPRRWRFDWGWPDLKIAAEQEGAVWAQGRHTRGSGFIKDMEKYNHAAKLGYLVFRFQPKDFINGTAQIYMAEIIDRKINETTRVEWKPSDLQPKDEP